MTLTDLFASTAQMNPQAQALSQSMGPLAQRRSFTYAAADRAVQRTREHLADLGLAPGDVVVVSLGATVEAPVAILAALRAGLTPCLVPVTFTAEEAREVMRRVGARAVVTTGAIGSLRPVDVMRDAAVNGGGPRFVLAFGERLPAGVIRLDEALLRSSDAGFEAPAGLSGESRPAILIAGRLAGSLDVVRHEQSSLVAGGLLAVLTAGIGTAETVLSTLSPMSMAGLVTGLVPCLLTAGTLALEPVFSSATFLASLDALGTCHVAGPGALEGPVGEAGLAGARGLSSLALVHRPPARLDRVPGTAGWTTRTIDVLACGERGVILAGREADGRPALSLEAARIPDGDGAVVTEAKAGPAGDLDLRGHGVGTPAGQPAGDGATWVPAGCMVRCDERGLIVSVRT